MAYERNGTFIKDRTVSVKIYLLRKFAELKEDLRLLIHVYFNSCTKSSIRENGYFPVDDVS